jgi:hypothetical protein
MPTVTSRELQKYQKETSAAVEAAQALEVTTYENVMDAADFLINVKSIGEQINERKEEITKPLNDALKSTRTLFKEAEQAYVSAEEIAKDKVLAYHYAAWGKGERTDNTIAGSHGKITLVERDVVEIIDEKSIPRDLCTPDPELVKHYLLSGKKLKGARIVKSYTIAAGKL